MKLKEVIENYISPFQLKDFLNESTKKAIQKHLKTDCVIAISKESDEFSKFYTILIKGDIIEGYIKWFYVRIVYDWKRIYVGGIDLKYYKLEKNFKVVDRKAFNQLKKELVINSLK